MLVDMFGTPLAVGQHILFADAIGDYGPELVLMRLTEVAAPDVIIAEQLSGEFMGGLFHLTDPIKRIAVIGNNRAVFNMADCYNDSTVN